jgi:uncharacterized protein (TIGR00297 family)
MNQAKLNWQSKTVLLLVLPFVAAYVMLQTRWWGAQMPSVAIWTVGISLLLGLVALKLRSATPGAAAAGAVITARLMFSTVRFPYLPWQTALTPVVALLVLTSITTRIGKNRKDKLGTGEGRRGRAASQVAANLGVAAIVSSDLVQSWIVNSHWFSRGTLTPIPVLIPALAALAEAAADTVSSELGQVLSSQPRMITTLRRADAGTDGAISVGGTLVGIVAAGIVAFVGSVVLRGSAEMLPMLAICLTACWAPPSNAVAGSTTTPSIFCRRRVLQSWLLRCSRSFLIRLSGKYFAVYTFHRISGDLEESDYRIIDFGNNTRAPASTTFGRLLRFESFRIVCISFVAQPSIDTA